MTKIVKRLLLEVMHILVVATIAILIHQFISNHHYHVPKEFHPDCRPETSFDT